MRRHALQLGLSLALAAILWLVVGVWHWWLVGLLIVVLVELPVWRPAVIRTNLPQVAPRLVAGLSGVLILTSYPVGRWALLPVAAIYAAWRFWLCQDEESSPYVGALIGQALALEAIFVWAVTTDGSRTIVTALVWLVSFVIAWDVTRRQSTGRPSAEAVVLAATWALVAAEIAWVLQAWLVAYVLGGQALLIPQPVLVLTGVAYCFGSIYTAQRQGRLSRSRLLEYVVVGFVVLAIVVLGTNWQATL